jgi:uncharacterized Zn finger protein
MQNNQPRDLVTCEACGVLLEKCKAIRAARIYMGKHESGYYCGRHNLDAGDRLSNGQTVQCVPVRKPL